MMPERHISRRDILRTAACSPLWLPIAEQFFSAEAAAQPKPAVQKQPSLNRYPRMVHEWFVKQLREFERKNLAAKANLKTKADAEKHVADVRKRILTSFGPLPEKTPLKPRITKVIKRDGYNVENLIFESRPGFLVTANLYVPTNRTGKLPGVVGTCGHSTNGKASGAYQSFSQGLVKQGYVVLIYDPIGQGERSQYVDEHHKDEIRVGTRQHLHGGNQQFLAGEFLGTWRAWDGIRALDYLRTRKEVDPDKIGVTGNSGGGTMTTWLCGVENRWSMAAPSCFVTTFRRNMENELPADTEQCPPRALALGLDHDDFIAAMAPKPVILLAKEKDFFDVRGTQEAYKRLKRLYKLLGAEENISLFIGPTYHGYSQENREAMYGWFNKATGAAKGQKEPPIKLEKDETLWCTPKGQVAALKSKTVFDFTRDAAMLFKRTRKSPNFEALRSLIIGTIGGEVGEIELHINEENQTLFKGTVIPPQKLRAFLRTLLAGRKNTTVFIRPHTNAGYAATLRLFSAVKLAGGRIFLRVMDSEEKDNLDEGSKKTSGAKKTTNVKRADERSILTSEASPRYRIIRQRGRSRNYPSKYHITYAVETEPGMQAIVYRLSDERLDSRPPRGKKRAVLYVSHQSADAELRDEPLIKSVIQAEPGVPFFTLDVRGIGESRPGTAGADPYKNPYGADYFYAIHSLMLDKPYVGQRTHDVLRVLDWLRSVGHTEVHLVAKGWGALPATFAAVLSNQVKQVTLKNALTSFHDIATTEMYDWPLSSFVPGVLKSFDLPDCYAALKNKKLKQIEPRGAKS
jgi:dienelactone hydrolase